MSPEIDISIEDRGWIIVLHPESEAGRKWLAENIDDDGYQPYLPSVIVERRYAGPIIDGIWESGLVLA